MSIPVICSKSLGQGKPIVLIHPFPLWSDFWEGLEPIPGFRLIFPDFPGFGLSPAPVDKVLTFTDAAAGLKNHLEGLSLAGPFVLGGISMGGYWAMEFYRNYPGEVRALIFSSTRPGADKPEGRQKRLDMALRVEKEGTGFLPDAMTPTLLGKSTLDQKPEIVQKIRHWIEKTPASGVALAQRTMADRLDQTQLLAGLPVKTLILAGAEDILIPPAEAKAMTRLIPDSSLQIIDHVGHLIPIENPDLFQLSLNTFLA